jgi:hypothetical protein
MPLVTPCPVTKPDHSLKRNHGTFMMKFLKSTSPLIPLGFILFWSLAIFFFFFQLFFPQCCDANSYLAIARRYNSEGIVEVQNSLRTFAYPWILSLLIKVSNALNIPQVYFIFLAQSAAYYFSVRYIANSFLTYSTKLSASLYLALCANIFLIPYLGITLTDGVYTIVSILILVILLNIDNLRISSASIPTKSVLIVTSLVGLALVIRPAAIWLLAPYGYCMIRIMLSRKVSPLIILTSILIGAIPLYFQAIINIVNFKILTIFPIDDLGNDQIRWGIQNIKYSTWLGGSEPVQNFYSSAKLITYPAEPSGYSLSWYFLNFVDAVKLLLFKFVGAFDFDYLMPYPYHSSASSWFASFFSFTILWLGLLGTFVHTFTGKLTQLGDRFAPLIILISWSAVNLVSALELRFTLPLLTYFIIVAVILIHNIVRESNRKLFVGILSGWLVVLPLCYLIAIFIRAQSNILPS